MFSQCTKRYYNVQRYILAISKNLVYFIKAISKNLVFFYTGHI